LLGKRKLVLVDLREPLLDGDRNLVQKQEGDKEAEEVGK
jgi:hypothetical protein